MAGVDEEELAVIPSGIMALGNAREGCSPS